MSKRTPFVAAVAAALSALAVTVAGTAFGDQTKDQLEVDAFRACLVDHGATAAPGGDGRALKQWLVADERTTAEKAAMKACGFEAEATKGGDGTKPAPGPDEQELRTCLTEHGATPPAGPDGLKGWIIGDHTPAEKTALDACGIAPPGEKVDHVDCAADKKGAIAKMRHARVRKST